MTKEDFASLLTEYGEEAYECGCAEAVESDPVIYKQQQDRCIAAKQAVLDAYHSKGCDE